VSGNSWLIAAQTADTKQHGQYGNDRARPGLVPVRHGFGHRRHRLIGSLWQRGRPYNGRPVPKPCWIHLVLFLAIPSAALAEEGFGLDLSEAPKNDFRPALALTGVGFEPPAWVVIAAGSAATAGCPVSVVIG
jgi:hypothetical protein